MAIRPALGPNPWTCSSAYECPCLCWTRSAVLSSCVDCIDSKHGFDNASRASSHHGRKSRTDCHPAMLSGELPSPCRGCTTRHPSLTSDVRPVASIVAAHVHRASFDERLPFLSSKPYLLRIPLRFLRMSFVRILVPSGSSHTGEESKTCLRESYQHIRREALGLFCLGYRCRRTIPCGVSAIWARVLSARSGSW